MRPRSFLTLLSLAGALGVGGSAVAQAPSAKPAPPPAPVSNPAERIADRVQAFYDQVKTFEATFKQSYGGSWTKASTGSIRFQQPGKTSFRYTNNGNRVVSDGKVIKVYEKQNNQVFEQPVETSQFPAMLPFLLRKESLKQAFALTELPVKPAPFAGALVLLAKPRKATPAYEKMVLTIDSATYQVRRVILIDAQGNKNRFDFSGTRLNVPIPAGEFSFVPPPGAQVFRL